MLISRGRPLTRLHLFRTNDQRAKETQNLLKMDEDAIISHLMEKLDSTKWEKVTVDKVNSEGPMV